MSFSYYLIMNLIFYPSALLCYLPMKNHLRFSRRRTVLTVFALLSVIVFSTTLFEYLEFEITSYLELPFLLLFFICYHFTLRVPVSKTLGIFFTVVALLSICTIFSLCFDILRGLTGSLEDRMRSAVFYTSLGFVSVGLLSYPAAKYGSRMVDQTIPDGTWYTAALVSGMLFALNFQLRPLSYVLAENLSMTILILSMCVIQLLTWIVLQAATYHIVWSLKSGAEVKERIKIYEMQERQYLRLQRYMQTTEKMQHDFRHNIQVLAMLYEKGDYETLGQYLQQYSKSVPIQEGRSYTGHLPLNALLNYYAEIARQGMIAFEVKVALPDQLPISDVDLCGMIGNVLENAVNAASRAEERWIRLDILADSSRQLFIAATNSFDGVVQQKNGAYLSTRHRGSGIGLASISVTAGKYGGEARFYHEGKRFYTDIVVPLNGDGKE